MSQFTSAQNPSISPLLIHLQSLSEVWKEILRAPEPKTALRQLSKFLAARLEAGAEIYPNKPLRALHYVEPDAVRVVILGQDPYHGPNQAQGLAFSVPDSCPRPPSLRNIFKELALEYPAAAAMPGNELLRWAEQGVLLLNTVLTVEAHQPASHAKQGWEVVTDAIIKRVAQSPQPKVFMLWGSHAQAKQQLLPTSSQQLILTANHPSPLSALRAPKPFIGCQHFKQANEWLIQKGQVAIDWIEA
ncbi:MAG: uracil-DNA glycosylase [Paralcaligenes sp.]